MTVVYPVRAMNHMRTHNMIKVLSSKYDLTLATPVFSKTDYSESSKALSALGAKFYSLGGSNESKHGMRRTFFKAYKNLRLYLLGIDKEVTTYMVYSSKLLTHINQNNYSAIISNYWEGSFFFRRLDASVYKILDPHYAVEENINIINSYNYGFIRKVIELRKLRKSKKLEAEIVKFSNAVIPLSQNSMKYLKKIDQGKKMELVADGADLDYFINYSARPEQNTILFYGAMSSRQNIYAFWRLYNRIIPTIVKKIPELKLLVVGSNPPDDIIKISNSWITVTGFVEDIRPIISQALVAVIPMEHGSGFRGRVIELLALGVPVVGTQNALQSIDFENGTVGFIAESDQEIAELVIKILLNMELRNDLSQNARRFVQKNYSLNATFGRIFKILEEVNI